MRLIGELEQLLFDTVRAIAATIDAKDGYTHRHSERVATLAGNLAAELGLDGAAQQTAEFAALLHDVGKIAVPDSILNKPTSLTPDEFEAMKKHPLHGVEILSNIQSPSVTAVLPGVQYHHEHWDGTGYPEGLSGDAIPLLGATAGGRRLLRRHHLDTRVPAGGRVGGRPRHDAGESGHALRSARRRGAAAPARARRAAAARARRASVPA